MLVSGPELDAMPGFSPDGTRLAFIRDVPTSQVDTINAQLPVDLYVARDDGTELTRITSGAVLEPDLGDVEP